MEGANEQLSASLTWSCSTVGGKIRLYSLLQSILLTDMPLPVIGGFQQTSAPGLQPVLYSIVNYLAGLFYYMPVEQACRTVKVRIIRIPDFALSPLT